MITYATLTNAGSRKINEDSVGIREYKNKHWFSLADGLGGHGKGEVASALAVEESLRALEWDGNLEELLAQAVMAAQEKLLREQQRLGAFHEMKTTLVMLGIENNLARWVHVGDSRLYLFERDKLLERTLDHSVPQMLVAQGEIREKDIRFHEDRNRLLRVLGTSWERPRLTVSPGTLLKDNHSFLMCTDGFWELIDEKEMGRLLKKSQSPREWLSLMETVIKKNGSGKNMDNYSAIAVFVRG